MSPNTRVRELRQRLSRLRLYQKVYGEDNKVEIESVEQQLQVAIDRRSEYWRTIRMCDFSDWPETQR